MQSRLREPQGVSSLTLSKASATNIALHSNTRLIKKWSRGSLSEAKANVNIEGKDASIINNMFAAWTVALTQQLLQAVLYGQFNNAMMSLSPFVYASDIL